MKKRNETDTKRNANKGRGYEIKMEIGLSTKEKNNWIGFYSFRVESI